MKGVSVASKTLFVGTAIAIFILFAMMILFSVLDFRNRNRVLEDRMANEMQAIQLFIGESYILGDYVSIRRYLDSYARLSHWHTGIFFDSSGVEIWRLTNEGQPKNFINFQSDIRDVHGNILGTLTLVRDTSGDADRWDSQLMLALLGFSVIAILGIVIQNMSLFRVLRPVSDLTEELRAEANLLGLNLKVAKGQDEVSQIKNWFSKITDSWRQEKEAASQKSHFEGMAQVASQVAHDIRSPLSALNLVVSTLTNLPEEKRILIRSSVNRINDIANDLLCKSKSRPSLSSQNESFKNGKAQIEMLSALVDLLVSEKRIQIRDKFDIDIEVDLSNSYGAFVEIDPAEFKRVLSNLINNSIEALSDTVLGRVKVQVRCLSTLSAITIQDNGKGISPEILPSLGQQGFSHGKNGSTSGNGLGLYHARNTIEAAGGTFKIESTPNEGTAVTITIPNAKRPAWFIDSLVLKPRQTIIICDDDSSIHGLWKGRFNSLGLSDESPGILHFTGVDQFSVWQFKNPYLTNALYLMDYELLGSSKTGLDLIEEFNLKDQAILVTSRYEEESIKQRCLRLGVKIIPKGMAGFISLKIRPVAKFWDCILIDDDSLVRACWEIASKERGKSLLTFASAEEFWAAAESIDKNSPIFVDVNLANDTRGETVAVDLKQSGFRTVSLATGYEKSEIDTSIFDGPITSKDFPL